MNFRPMKLLPLAAALALAPLVGAHAQSLDLLKAYQQAIANDPTLAQQVAARNNAATRVVSSRASLLPSLSAGLSIGQNRTYGSGPGRTIVLPNGQVIQQGNTGYSRSRGWSVSLSQTILNFADYANLSAAKATNAAAEATYQANLQGLIMRVTQAYFNVLTAKDGVAVQQANVDSLKRQFDQAQQRLKAGLSAITDVQDAKAQYESARAQLIVAQNQLNDAREGLTEITGQPVHNLEVLKDKLPMEPPKPNNLGTWVDQAKLNNPNILADKFNVQAAEHSIDAARDQRLPTISASLGYSGRGASWSQFGPYDESPAGSSISLQLSVPIFNGFATRAGVKSAIYSRDSAQAQLVQQRRLVVRNTRNYFRSVLSGISQIEAARQAVISSESALKATQAGLLVGTQTIVDVLRAQQTLVLSRNQYSDARHQFILNKLLLKQASGTLTFKDLKLINALLLPASEVKGIQATPTHGAAAGGMNGVMPAGAQSSAIGMPASARSS